MTGKSLTFKLFVWSNLISFRYHFSLQFYFIFLLTACTFFLLGSSGHYKTSFTPVNHLVVKMLSIFKIAIFRCIMVEVTTTFIAKGCEKRPNILCWSHRINIIAFSSRNDICLAFPKVCFSVFTVTNNIFIYANQYICL